AVWRNPPCLGRWSRRQAGRPGSDPWIALPELRAVFAVAATRAELAAARPALPGPRETRAGAAAIAPWAARTHRTDFPIRPPRSGRIGKSVLPAAARTDPGPPARPSPGRTPTQRRSHRAS